MLQQGTGLVDAKAAVYGTTNNCANQGLNIAADLNGTQHYMGRVTQNADGTFQVTSSQWRTVGRGLRCGMQGYIWDAGLPVGRRATSGAQGYLWPEGFLWSTAHTYSVGHSLGRRISVDHRHRRQHDVADVRQLPGSRLNS